MPRLLDIRLLRFGFVLAMLGTAVLTSTLKSSSRDSVRSDAGESVSSSVTYYVAPSGNDSAAGTASEPWATLQHAALIAATPGTTVRVAPGTYNGPITTEHSGTSGARINFVSDVRWGAVIRSRPVDVIWTNTGDFIGIFGFDIAGPARIGIGNLGSNVVVFGNNVHNIPGAGCNSRGGAGIVNGNYKGHDDDIINNVVHDIGQDPSIPCATIHGIYHSNLRGKILNNIAYRNQGFGIHLWHYAKSVVVANNLMFQNGHGGLVVGADEGSIDDGTVVVNNIAIYNGIWDLQGRGIIEENRTGIHNLYSNNLVWGNKVNAVATNGSPVLNTIVRNPQLADYRADGNGNYRPVGGSPALNAGTIEYCPDYDFDGATRHHGPPDIGPYQRNARPSVWPPAF